MERSWLVLGAIALGAINEFHPLSESTFILIAVFGAALLVEHQMFKLFSAQAVKISSLEDEIDSCKLQIESLSADLFKERDVNPFE